MAITPSVSVGLNPVDLAPFEAKLDARQLRAVVQSAMSEVCGRAGPARLAKHVTEVITITRKAARDAIGGGMVDRKNLLGVIRVSEQPTNIADYNRLWVSPGRHGQGVTVQFEATKRAITFAHGFKATLESGHVGIFERVKLGARRALTAEEKKRLDEGSQSADLLYHGLGKIRRRGKYSAATAAAVGRKSFIYLEDAKVTAKGIASRFPIKEIHGPTVFSAMTAPRFQGLTEKELRELNEMLLSRVESKTKAMLEGKLAVNDRGRLMPVKAS